MQADLDGFFSRLKGRGSGPRLRRAKQNRTKKLPSCSRYLIQNLPTALLLSNRTNQQQTQSHMQVEFVVGFSLGTPVFPLLKNQHFQILIDHLRVPKTLTFKTRLSAKNLSCENEFHLHENKKIVFTLKGLCHSSRVHFV